MSLPKQASKSLSKLRQTNNQFRNKVRSYRQHTQNYVKSNRKLQLPHIHLNNNLQAKIFGMAQNTKTNLMQGIKDKSPEKDYQKCLTQIDMSQVTFKKIFQLKCLDCETNNNRQKYKSFIKFLFAKLNQVKQIKLTALNCNNASLKVFADWLLTSKNSIIQLDASYCLQLCQNEFSVLVKLLSNSKSIIKYNLSNLNLTPKALKIIFQLITKSQNVVSLNIGNSNGQNLNRFADQFQILNEFISKNISLASLNLSSLQLKKQGLMQISSALLSNSYNSLQILDLSNNFLSSTTFHQIQVLAKKIIHLNLSQNPLGEQFFIQMAYWKHCTIQCLDLSNTNMTSMALITFLTKTQQCRSIRSLTLNKNDFSDSWLNQINEKLPLTLDYLSLISCHIHSFASIFEGLTNHKSLHTLLLNNNVLDNDTEGLEKIIRCFISNQSLIDVRMRLCGFTESSIVNMFKVLRNNKTIKIIDLSENYLGEYGGKCILNALQQNIQIENVIIEKMQVPDKIREEINKKLKLNKSQRGKKEFVMLKAVSTQMKERDQYTWDQLSQLEQYAKRQNNTIKIISQKIQKIQKINKNKKQENAIFMMKKKEEEKQIYSKYIRIVKTQEQMIKNLQKKIANRNANLNKIQAMKNNQKIIIERLQCEIKETHKKNKKLQNQLQDILKNEKYKKTQHKKMQRQLFDPLKSINSKIKRNSIVQ